MEINVLVDAGHEFPGMISVTERGPNPEGVLQ
jgi:hypothetical protein